MAKFLFKVQKVKIQKKTKNKNKQNKNNTKYIKMQLKKTTIK